MTRLVLNKVEQNQFLREVGKKLELGSDQLGLIVGITGRSFRDWVNGRTVPNKEGIMKLSKLSGVAIPRIIEEREEWWSGRVNGHIGAIARLKKYGVTLTKNDRVKGGHNSQLRRAENPDYYRALGCNIPNEFVKPYYSEALAEVCGLILGDGGLTTEQCQITLHFIDDYPYSLHVSRLINHLFGMTPHVYENKVENYRRLLISGIKFVAMMTEFGLQTGNKTRNQVGIPSWINENNTYLRGCLRGLFDTDGGTFTHRHVVGGHKYINFGITFTSASSPLLNGFVDGLARFNIKAYINGFNAYIYKTQSVKRFFNIIKPRNIKHISRYGVYLSGKF